PSRMSSAWDFPVAIATRRSPSASSSVRYTDVFLIPYVRYHPPYALSTAIPVREERQLVRIPGRDRREHGHVQSEDVAWIDEAQLPGDRGTPVAARRSVALIAWAAHQRVWANMVAWPQDYGSYTLLS